MDQQKRIENGRKGGLVGGAVGGSKTGPTKRRGDPEYYRVMAIKSWAKRRNKALVAMSPPVNMVINPRG